MSLESADPAFHVLSATSWSSQISCQAWVWCNSCRSGSDRYVLYLVRYSSSVKISLFGRGTRSLHSQDLCKGKNSHLRAVTITGILIRTPVPLVLVDVVSNVHGVIDLVSPRGVTVRVEETEGVVSEG